MFKQFGTVFKQFGTGISAILLLVFGSGPGLAISGEDVGSPAVAALSWEDISRLMDQHPAIGEARYQVEAARAQVWTAAQIPNPSLQLEVGQASSAEEGAIVKRSPEWGIELSIPLDWLATRGYEVDSAKANLEAAQLEAYALRLEVFKELKSLFWNLAYDQGLVQVLEETEAQVTQLASLIRLRVDKGEARPIEVPRIETELERVRNELEIARTQVRTHRTQLSLWLDGGDTLANLSVTADLSALPPLPDLNQAIQRLTADHPLLRAGRFRLQATSAQLGLEKRKRLPGLSLGGFYGHELDKSAMGGVVEVSLPLWNWNSGAIARAQAERSAEEKRLDVSVRQLSAALLEAFYQCSQDRDTVTRFQKELLPRAETTARTIEMTFRAGETNLIDVLDARRVLLEARRDYQSAQLQLQLNCTNLATLTGEIDHE